MTKVIEEVTYFHAAKQTEYNDNHWEVGMVLNNEDSLNPHFRYFNSPVMMHATKRRLWATSSLLKIQFNLMRELIYEQIRLEVAPNAPSRQSCIWLSETRHEAVVWARDFGSARVFEVRASGRIHTADEGYLIEQLAPLALMEDSARKYWRGEQCDRGTVFEHLFQGTLEVVREIDAQA